MTETNKPRLVHSAPSKKEIRAALTLFLSTYTEDDFKTKSSIEFQQDYDDHIDKVVAGSADPDQARIKFDYFKEELYGEVAKKVQALEAKLSHAQNLGIESLGHDERNDIRLVNRYIKKFEGKFIKEKHLIVHIWALIKEIGGRDISMDMVKNLVYLRRETRLEDRKSDLRLKLAYDGTSYETAIDKLCIFLLPVVYDATEVRTYAQVLYHFMWQTKRKLNGLKAAQHMAAIFLTKAKGNGKTEFVRNFCRDFYQADASFYAERKIKDFASESKIRNIANNYIINLDEARGFNSSHFECFRTIMTAENLQIRPLYLDNEDTVPAIHTCIGSANAISIGEIYDDPKGERRLFGIRLKELGFKNIIPKDPSALKLGHLTEAQASSGYMYPLEGFNALIFWKMVDESLPVMVDADKLQKFFDQNKPDDGVEAFALYYALDVTGPDAYRAYFPKKILYGLYKEDQLRKDQRDTLLNYREFCTSIEAYLLDQYAIENQKQAPENHVSKEATRGTYRKKECFILHTNSALERAFNTSLVDHLVDPVAYSHERQKLTNSSQGDIN